MSASGGKRYGLDAVIVVRANRSALILNFFGGGHAKLLYDLGFSNR